MIDLKKQHLKQSLNFQYIQTFIALLVTFGIYFAVIQGVITINTGDH
ncbi:hypothetical protein [Fusibacter sp. 3D3]|nr:hypothetical protein [Fusibacter sp. 3D3]GAU78952.1 hypothetical protein F3D3_3588 [Fusibacter sp. 3D3]